MPAPAEPISIIVDLTRAVLDLKVIVRQQEGPPGKLGILGLGMMEVLQGCMVSEDHKLCTCQVSVELGDSKN